MTTEFDSPPFIQLGRAFDHLHHLIGAKVFHYLAGAMHRIDLSFSQLHTLFHLSRYGPQCISALAQASHLSHAATSRLVEKLVRDGLVDRREMPGNRRQKRVALTEAGLEQLSRLREATAQAYAELFSEVPAGFRQELADILTRIQPFLPTEPQEEHDCGPPEEIP